MNALFLPWPHPGHAEPKERGGGQPSATVLHVVLGQALLPLSASEGSPLGGLAGGSCGSCPFTACRAGFFSGSQIGQGKEDVGVWPPAVQVRVGGSRPHAAFCFPRLLGLETSDHDGF